HPRGRPAVGFERPAALAGAVAGGLGLGGGGEEGDVARQRLAGRGGRAGGEAPRAHGDGEDAGGGGGALPGGPRPVGEGGRAAHGGILAGPGNRIPPILERRCREGRVTS